MARREDEPVAVEPLRVRGAVAERMPEEHRAHLGAAERKTEVPALARVHGIHGKPACDRGGLGEALYG